MEAKYENSILTRLQTLNAMKALCESLRYNCYETIKGLKVIIERQDGTTVTEQLREDEIKTIADAYMAEQDRLTGGPLTEALMNMIESIKAQQVNK